MELCYALWYWGLARILCLCDTIALQQSSAIRLSRQVDHALICYGIQVVSRVRA